MLNKNIPIAAIALSSRLRSQQLYIEREALPAPPPMPVDQSQQTHQPQTSPETSAQRPKSIKAIDEAINVLRAWLSLACIFLTQTEIYLTIGITSGSKQAKIKKLLLLHQLIKEHWLSFKKTRMSIWEPTDKAYDSTHIQKPQHKSKGGYLHQFIAQHIVQWAKQQGYMAQTEYFLSNNKAIDVLLRSNDELIFIEIGMSSAQNELENAVNDLSTEMIPDKLILACKDTKMKKALEVLVQTDSRLDSHRAKIDVVLAGNFIQINK